MVEQELLELLSNLCATRDASPLNSMFFNHFNGDAWCILNTYGDVYLRVSLFMKTYQFLMYFL